VKNKLNYYSKQGLWSLFLICAFPLHFWTIILIFNDAAWIAKRSTAWDSVGVASYGLVFGFIESWLLFFMTGLLGFLISTKWNEERRVAVMSALVAVLSLWAMIGQLYFFLNTPLPESWVLFFASVGHPLRFLYGAVFVLVLPTVTIPTMLLLKFEKPLKFVSAAIEKITLLVTFYLFFDFIGLIILIVRNV
jgi:hypothetical protein